MRKKGLALMVALAMFGTSSIIGVKAEDRVDSTQELETKISWEGNGEEEGELLLVPGDEAKVRIKPKKSGVLLKVGDLKVRYKVVIESPETEGLNLKIRTSATGEKEIGEGEEYVSDYIDFDGKGEDFIDIYISAEEGMTNDYQGSEVGVRILTEVREAEEIEGSKGKFKQTGASVLWVSIIVGAGLVGTGYLIKNKEDK